MCQVAETLPWRNLRSEDMKGVNIGIEMQRDQKGMYAQKSKNLEVC